jgi:NAD(P)-dependent dehydrogenase (short-subunit alcohol dehydrogenase family)
MEITGAAAIVTGGASGLGLATAMRLASRGATVTILDRTAGEGRSAAREIGGHFVAVDVTDEAAICGALAEAEVRHGTARILVNCAGIAPPAKVIARDGTPMPLAEFSRTIAVNLIGTFNVLSQFAARLAAAEPVGEERGVVVNTASVAAFEGQIGQAAYAASKGGVAAMGLPVARELARFGIRVMTIAPGLFRTSMLAALPEEVQDSLGRQVPFPARLGRPEEYAELVEAIIRNPMLNGETIRLDGAIRMAPK